MTVKKYGYLEDMTPTELRQMIEEVNRMIVDEKASVRNLMMRNMAYMYLTGLHQERENIINGNGENDGQSSFPDFAEWMKRKFDTDDDD